MKIKKLLYLTTALVPSLSLAQQVKIPQQINNDTIYVQQANLTPTANQVGNSRIIIGNTGTIDTFSSGTQYFAHPKTGANSTMNDKTNNISITENYWSIGGGKILDGISVLLGKTFAKNGIIFENGASILPTGRELSFIASAFNLVAQSTKIGNIFSIDSNLANFANKGIVQQKLVLNTANKNGFEIDDFIIEGGIENHGNGPLSDYHIVSADYAGVVGTRRTLANNQIETRHFAPGSVQANNIKNGAATKEKFVYGSVTKDKIAFDTLVTNLFKPGTITADKIPNGSIDAKKVDSSSVQLRVTGSTSGRFAINTINQNGTIVPIEVCLRPKFPGEMTNAGEVWNSKDPEWKKWGGSSCKWENAYADGQSQPKTCSKTCWNGQSMWQGQWNTKAEDSWQNCENWCPVCPAKSPTSVINGSCASQTTTTTTYTLIEGGNNYGTKGGECQYQATTGSPVSTPDTTSAACKPAQSNGDPKEPKEPKDDNNGRGYRDPKDGKVYNDKEGTDPCKGKGCDGSDGDVERKP